MKSFIFKKPDGGIMIIHPNESKFGDELRDFTLRDEFISARDNHDGYFEVDRHTLCDLSNRCESRKQLYHDGDTVKVDTDWSLRLMPAHCIRNRHIAAIDKSIDEFIGGNITDPIQAIKCQREKEKCMKMKCECLLGSDCDCGYDEFWYNIALQNLDKRVAKGEPDKPVIREKLQQRLQELKKEEK